MRLDVAHMMKELPLMYAETVAVNAVEEDDGSGVLPPELRAWLVKLRLLEGVPFANLVVDTELLPEESIRWFYIDRRWTDALVQGALSVGTVNSDDRVQLTSRYDQVRGELDAEERNVRRSPGSARLGGDVAPISGFLLRSRAVSGWPGLHVRAFTSDPAAADDAFYPEDDPSRMRLLRLERLAPAVLLCLFDGIPSVVHIEEPRQGVQFGFTMKPKAGGFEATLRPRAKATFDYLNVPAVPVPFRVGGAPGVVDIQNLERRLADLPATGGNDGLDSGEYALQLIQRPFRQVFGDPENVPIKDVFTVTLKYSDLVKEHMFKGGPA